MKIGEGAQLARSPFFYALQDECLSLSATLAQQQLQKEEGQSEGQRVGSTPKTRRKSSGTRRRERRDPGADVKNLG